MTDLSQITADYGPARAVLTRADGATEEVSGAGGGLAAAVENRGVGYLVGLLASGDVLVLEDEEATLELHRDVDSARMRVSWSDGPTYEERVPAPQAGGVTLVAPAPQPTAAPAPAPASPAPATASTALSASAMFTPDPSSRVADLRAALHDITCPLFVTADGVFTRGQHGAGQSLLAMIPAISAADLGAKSFQAAHGVRASYVSGAMAGGIGSPAIVIAMANVGLIGFYGAGGLPLEDVTKAVAQIKQELGDLPAGFNLLHNPAEPGVEDATVDLYLKHNCRTVSASAFMRLTSAIVRYRLHGIHRDSDGRIVVPNKVFAKVSRAEVAEPFMRPAPAKIVRKLTEAGVLSAEAAELATMVPMAEDITAEADSGGHTDRRPLVVLLPTLLRLRDKVVAEEGYAERGIAIRVGAAGGIGDPASAYAALSMGADYLLTGSINQATVEAGTSDMSKEMVAQAGMADCITGPAPDMFEMGAHVQVLGRGSMYAQRATRLYELYRAHGSMDEIPEKARAKIEKTIFRQPLDEVWANTRAYWADRDPREIERAEQDPRHKMALTFRWYLGMTSRWARIGEADRKRDFQIWCGPSMGLFNGWVAGTWLEPLAARGVVAIANAVLGGAAALRRVELARSAGVDLPPGCDKPDPWRSE
jgi:trans-AT polyketide synthase/acyltransferase/oxidoreductase domain-containing protein